MEGFVVDLKDFWAWLNQANANSKVKWLLIFKFYKFLWQVNPFTVITLWASNTTTILIDNWGAHFYDWIIHIFRVFCNGWINWSDAFHAVICLQHCIMGKYKVYWIMDFLLINK